ncbi:MAG: DUF1269 domain-containing protein [Myxococcales bacterium]|nr:DUF1269 domain-containing protein [Myxococcales bacterium]
MDNLALITFDDEAKTYQALSELKRLEQTGAVDLEEAAVVVRERDGTLAIKDAVGVDMSGASTGSIIGLLVGLFAGPVGLLLGWVTGGLIGATADVARTTQTTSLLTFLGTQIPVGTTALIAALSEPTTDALDALVQRLGGKAVRHPAAAVQEAIASAQAAERAARDAAHKVMHEDRPKGDWHSKWEDVKAALRRALHV